LNFSRIMDDKKKHELWGKILKFCQGLKNILQRD
jgi:hypothetical protein